MSKISVSLTRKQWLTVLRAADNGALSGDAELCEDMFPSKSQRKAFLAAVRKINDTIGAGYTAPESYYL